MSKVHQCAAGAIGFALSAFVAPSLDAWATSCQADAECSGGICVASVCEMQPLGLSHIAEIQFDPSALTTLADAAALQLRDGSGTNLCAIPTFTCPTAPGETCFVNRVEFPGPLTIRRSGTVVPFQAPTGATGQVDPVQAVLPVVIHVKSNSCVDTSAAGCAFDDESLSVPSNAIFDLSASVDNNGTVQLCGGFAGLDPSYGMSVPPVPDACVPIDQISSLTNRIVGGALADLAISANRDLTRIGVRVWFTDPPQTGDLVAIANETYQVFFDGLLAPSPAGTAWSVFFGEDLMLKLARVNAFTQVELAGGPGVFPDPLAHSPPWEVSWDVPPAVPFPKASLQIYAREDAGGCEAHLTLAADVSFKLDLPNQRLQLFGSMDYDVDVDGCFADFLPGADAVADAFFAGQIPSGTFFALDNMCWFDGDTLAFECDLPILSPWLALPPGPSVRVSIDQLFGDPTGLIAGGSIFWLNPHVDSPTSAAAFGFAFGWGGSCSDQSIGYLGELQLDGGARVCSVNTVEDPLSEYLLIDPDPSELYLPKNYSIQDTWGASATYPFHAAIRTTNGSGMVSLPIPTQATLGQTIAAFSAMINECYRLETGWLGIPGKYDPRWSVDPPIDPLAVLTLASGVSLTGTVRLEDVELDSIGPVQGKKGSAPNFPIYQHGGHVSGRARVTSPSHAEFVVPFGVDILADLNATPDAAGHALTKLSPAASLHFPVNIPPSSLPPDIRSLSFSLPLATGDVFVGFLPDSHVVLSWPFDELHGTAATDRSGRGNTGTLTGFSGSTWTSSGLRNGALSFSGTAANYVDGGDGATVNPAQITLSAWINSRTAGRTAYETIVNKVNGSNRQYALGIARGGKLQFVAAGVQLDGAALVSASAWHHVVATYDGAIMKLYLDGHLDASLAVTGRLVDNHANVTAGGQRASTGTLPFNGTLDEVRIYDLAIDAVQAASTYW